MLSRLLPLALPTILVASLLVVIWGPLHLVGWIALCFIPVANWVLHQRRVMAGDGAEQMATLILVAAGLVAFPGLPDQATPLGVWFIGAESILAYTAAGIAKALSPAWRGGHALSTIIGSEAHGHAGLATWLDQNPVLARQMTRCVMMFECCFLAFILAPPPIAIAALGAGLLFHVLCAVFMKLNTFLWAFPATYPCVWLVGEWLSPFR